MTDLDNTELSNGTESEAQDGNYFASLVQMVAVRLKEFTRRPEAVFWVYLFPLLMMIVLGVAFRNKPVEKITVDLQEPTNAQNLSGEAVRRALENDERIRFDVFAENECRQRLKTGKSDLFIRIDDSAIGRSQTEYDRTEDSAVSGVSYEYVFDPTRPGSLVAKATVDDLLQDAAGRRPKISSTEVEFSEPGGRYIDWLIPGLIGMGLMGGGLWGVGFAIVDMRIRKLLKRFLATPMKRTHFLAAVMISRLLFMIPQIVFLLVASRLIFDVRVLGSYFAVIVLIFVGAVQFSGIGLLVAARTRTMESVSGLMNLIMLPMWTLSGIFFSYERFPEVVHPLIRLLPLTALNDALRAVMTEGTSIATLWPEMTVMVAWTVVTFIVSLLIFRWGD